MFHTSLKCCQRMMNGISLNSSGFINTSHVLPTFGLMIARGSKHWNPKFKKLRSLKMVKVKLPDFEELNKPVEELTKEELKAKMKERGILPDRPWVDKPIYISSTGGVFEPYVPPEGDGKVSAITTQGAKQKLEFIEKKSKSMLALRKIRNFEEDFDFPIFLNEAQEIYINSHLAMMNKDQTKLLEYVTERAYPEVVDNIGDKTIHWEFIESIEKPRVAHVRCTDVISKENIFSQITVRFHTKQGTLLKETLKELPQAYNIMNLEVVNKINLSDVLIKLVIYDRFGRLIHGSKTLPKDVLEYVVFEKHISNKYGLWRVHDKIIPDWMPPKAAQLRTHILQTEPSL